MNPLTTTNILLLCLFLTLQAPTFIRAYDDWVEARERAWHEEINGRIRSGDYALDSYAPTLAVFRAEGADCTFDTSFYAYAVEDEAHLRAVVVTRCCDGSNMYEITYADQPTDGWPIMRLASREFPPTISNYAGLLNAPRKQ